MSEGQDDDVRSSVGELVIERTADASQLEWPAIDVASGVDGERFNRSYQLFGRRNWAEAKRMLAIEESALVCGGEGEDDLDRDELSESLCGLDIGVASAVFALLAANCVPVYSCGGAPGHEQLNPVVLFRCRRPRLEDLLRVAERAGCGLIDGPAGTASVYADSAQTMIAFARELISTRSSLSRVRERKRHVSRTEVTQLALL